MSSGSTAPGSSPLKLSELEYESDLLHVIFHCYKNAHHCNGWWKWLGILRRNIEKLLDSDYASGLQARLEYMKLIVVPSCYRAFTSLIAGGHHVPLGLVLFAVIARVHRIIKVGKKGKEGEVEEVAEEEEMAVEIRESVKVNGTGLVVGPVTMEDFGETIRREGKREEREEEEEGGEEEEKEGGEEGGGEEEEEGEEGKQEQEQERERGEEKSMVVSEKKEVIITVKESEVVAQEVVATMGEVLLKRKRMHQEGISKDSITKAVKKDEERVTKKRKKRKEVASPSLQPLPLLRSPSPPMMKGLTIIRDKRKSQDKEGAKKKKKRKKGDEIDDLFAGLL